MLRILSIPSTIVYSLACLIATVSTVHAQTSIACQPGMSAQWRSGWCDFPSPVDFKKGERLRLAIGGSATKVIVRLLPKGADPNTPIGVIPAPYTVPQSRFIELVVPNDAATVEQISVHGGPSPWDQYPLGAGNGPATLTGVGRLNGRPVQSKR